MCKYTTKPGETRSATLKSKINQLEASNKMMRTLLRRLKYGNELEVASTVRQIKYNETISDDLALSEEYPDDAILPDSVQQSPILGSPCKSGQLPSGSATLGDSRLEDIEASPQLLTTPPSSRKTGEPSLSTDGHSRLPAGEISVPTYANKRRKRRTTPNVSGQIVNSEQNHSLLGERLKLDRICPFDSMFSRSEQQWGMNLVGDLDQCVKGAMSALPFLTDQEQALIPSASSLAAAVYDDDLLFGVAGLITCATCPESYGYHVSQRPNLIWCRNWILRDLQSRVTAIETPSRALLGVVALLSGWEWVSEAIVTLDCTNWEEADGPDIW